MELKQDNMYAGSGTLSKSIASPKKQKGTNSSLALVDWEEASCMV